MVPLEENFITEPTQNNGRFWLFFVMIFLALAVLEFGGLFWYNRFRAQAHDQKRKQDLSELANSLENYYADQGFFPVSQIESTESENSVLRKELKNYLDNLPRDPLAPRFFYVYKGNENQYELTAFLENKKDPEGEKSVDGKFWVYRVNAEKNPSMDGKKIKTNREESLNGDESDMYENELDKKNTSRQNNIESKAAKRKKTSSKSNTGEEDEYAEDDDYVSFSEEEPGKIDSDQELPSSDTPPSFPVIDSSLTIE